MMKLLVTGGAGFIGTNFILYMRSKSPEVQIVNVDKLTYAGNRDNLRHLEGKPGYEFVHGDIANKALMQSVTRNVDAIVNFAAETHVDRSISDSSEFVKTNVLGTQVLLDAALKAKVKRFHQISTDEVFGSLGPEGTFNEQTPYSPRSPYAASKAAADHLVMSYFHTHGLPATISHCSNNYGPYQYPEKVIPLFITNLIGSKKIPVYGKGLNIRDWIHVEDHCTAVDMTLHNGKPGETYCIGARCEHANIDVARKILSYLRKGEWMIEYAEDRKGHDYRYAVDPSKIEKELGWKPVHSFDAALKKTVNWYVHNENWWRPLKHDNPAGM